MTILPGFRTLACFAILSLLAGSLAVAPAALAAGLQAGDPAPVFAGKDISGAEVDLAALMGRNKAVLVNFWGLRCGACIEEMPYLNAVYRKYKERGLEIIGVNVDGIPAEVIRTQLPGLPVSPLYIILPDQDLKVADQYKLAVAPLTVLVESGGKVSYAHEGFRPGDERELESRIENLTK